MFLLAITPFASINGQENTIEKDSTPEEPIVETTEPVKKIDSIPILNGIGPYTAAVRSLRIQRKINEYQQATFSPELSVIKADGINDIMIGEDLIMTVTQADAEALGFSLAGATAFYLDEIENSLNFNRLNPRNSILINIGIALAILVIFYFGLRYYNRFFRLIFIKIHGQNGKRIKALVFKDYEYLSVDRVVGLVILVAKVIRLALLLFVIYLLLPLLFSLFPWTQGIAQQLFSYIIDPLKSIGGSFLNFIPNLFYIGVIVTVAYYLLKLLKFFHVEVEKKRLTIPGFYPEWARPTYNLLKTIVLALAFVAIWPNLPMSESNIFKGVSTFFGLLIALGGAGAFSNIIAGLVLTYMRSFKIGDRVKIGEVVGDVKEKTLLNTRLKTIKNEIITIPNSQMLNSHTINYSTANDENGLMLHTTITIGYEVPWREVHKLLVEAALKTEFVKKLPKPFVLQTSLDDFYVSYQLNARTREIHKMAIIYSDLHKNIQDVFNAAGVEIMSPHYASLRDGNHTTISSDKLPDDYQSPGFNVNGPMK
mgnify:CR=1 FL=1